MKSIKQLVSKFLKSHDGLVGDNQKFIRRTSLKALWLRLRFFLKIKCKKSWVKIKKNPALSFLVLVLILTITYLVLELTAVSASRLELLELKADISDNIICHEACRHKRQIMRDNLSLAVLNDDHLVDDIKDYFINPQTDVAFLEELLKIIQLAYDVKNTPEFLADYLVNPAGNEKIKSFIIRDFLANLDDYELVDYYYLVLSSAEGETLKTEAIRALGAASNKAQGFKEEHLEYILTFIFRNDLSLSLNLDLIFLLTEYYPFFPEETQALLIFIYDNHLDPVLKYIAQDMLQELAGLLLPEIVVPVEAWERYFN